MKDYKGDSMKLPIYIIVVSSPEVENAIVYSGEDPFQTTDYFTAIQKKTKLTENYSAKFSTTYKILRCTEILGV